MYEGYDKEAMVLVDPQVNPGAFLAFIYSTHPKCPPVPKNKFNFQTGEDLTLKDFYVKQEYLHSNRAFNF